MFVNRNLIKKERNIYETKKTINRYIHRSNNILLFMFRKSKKQEKDMSFAESPEIMVCRVIDAIASDDEAAYNNCCSGIENSYNQSFDDIYEKYAMQCREFGIDYETKRSAEDFNVYIYNDKRDTEGFVSFVVYLEDSELVKFHIKTQYDINKKDTVLKK